ncbi:MAG: tandem-95 repeat protein, partial [Gammaproteobacteria bacterium]|nr:tandem-95 repeat protein [Gammaproteobacteria bacterium]
MASKIIGFVVELTGSAQIRTFEGVIKVLSIGDTVSDGDLLITGLNTQIVLEFFDGRSLQVGASTELLLDETVFAGLDAFPDDRVDQLAELQSQIIEGLDFADLEAPAAGATGDSDALHQASIYLREGKEGIVETRGTPFDLNAIDDNDPFPPGDDYALIPENSGVQNPVSTTSINNAPVAIDDAITATEDTPFTSAIDLDANDTDLDGDALSVVAGTFATTQGGSITIAADGSYTYTPAANFNGVDSIDYTVTDGSLTDVGTLTINVTAVNDAPVAVDDAVTATKDTPFNSVIDLDANDTDLDGDALSVVAGTFATTQGGSITIAGDGSYTYTPVANFNGVDSVDYTVTDGSLTDVGTLTINVTAVNDAPIAVDDAVTATEDTPFNSVIDLDANDTDLDGDALSVVAGTFATTQGGSITIAADGSYTYTPVANFNGVDSVDYTVTDGSLSDVGTLTINVTAVNDAPVAVDDAVTATEDTPFNSAIELDANDTDLDGDALSVVAGTFATTQGGSITIAVDGSYTYTPVANFNGVDSVDYTVTDGSLTDVGTLTINVTAVNDAPVAVDDSVTATEDTPFNSAIDLDANDTDLDGDALSVVAGTFATTQGGSITIAADGSYTYAPAANFNGVDS